MQRGEGMGGLTVEREREGGRGRGRDGERERERDLLASIECGLLQLAHADAAHVEHQPRTRLEQRVHVLQAGAGDARGRDDTAKQRFGGS